MTQKRFRHIGCAVLSIALIMMFSSSISYAAPPIWTVDPASSQVTFEGQVDTQVIKGKFAKVETNIQFDKKDLAHSSIRATIDMASAVTGDPAIDKPLLGKDWFNIAAFPQATFESTSIRSIGDVTNGMENYEAVGKLTILSVSKDIVLPFTLQPQDGNTFAQGFLKIQRLDFGIGKRNNPQPPQVANDVFIHIKLALKPIKKP